MKKQQPKYALHKATGQARVRINGKSIYLGPYGSEESHRRYDEIVTDYMKGTLNVSYHKLTIAQLCVSYVKHAKAYYVKNGHITSECEVRLMRMRDIDMSGEVWEYRPQEHKTEHHGRQRLIFIGPKGQDIVRQFLVADPERYLFSPKAAEEERSEER